MLKEDLHLVKKLATWVPHTFTDSQKEAREDIAYSNLTAYTSGLLPLNSMIAIDETWVPIYDPPSRHHTRFWVEPGTAAPKVAKPELHERKLLLTVGMDADGVAFWAVLDLNQTMNGERYCSFLDYYVSR